VEIAPERELVAVSTDTRALPPDALFVALRGERHDGHRYVDAARAAGAAVLVARDAGIEGPRLEVDDPLVALGALARAHVDRIFERHGRRPTLAIGGAAGKTTTRSLAGAGAEAIFGPALVSAGNLNNRIGVPMTLLTLDETHRALVLECATSERGEIPALAAIVRPDAALVLNADLEHSHGLGGLDEIADEEAALLLAARRTAVTLAEDARLVERLGRAPAPRRWTFGESETADVRLIEREVRADGSTRARIRLAEGLAHESPATLELTSPLLGPGAAANLTAAAAGVLALLCRPASRDELAKLTEAIARVAAVPGRLRPLVHGASLILDDTYNANPRSMRAALATAVELAARRDGARLTLALGDMLELGDWSAAAHDEILDAALATSPARLLLVGSEMSAAARRRGGALEVHDDSAAAAAALAAEPAPDGVVLLKGSRGTRMERLLPVLGVPET